MKPGDLELFNLKICDFGWCAQSNENGRSTFCGTLEYMAPEMLASAPHDQTLDVWSLGILLFELVHGNAPYSGKSPHEMQKKISGGVIKFSRCISEDYKDLVQMLL